MTYNEILSAGGSAVVLFYGAACAPCERLKPVLRQVCAGLKLELHELNSAGELPALKALGVRSVPAVFLVQRGEARSLFTGALDAETIRNKLALQGFVSPEGDLSLQAR